MKKKYQSGITLISIAIYVVAMTIIVSLVAVVTSFFYNNVVDMTDSSAIYDEFNSFNTYMLKEIKIVGNGVTEVNDNSKTITFSNGDIITFDTNGAYLNGVTILDGNVTARLQTLIENEKYILKINLFATADENTEKTFEYTLGDNNKIALNILESEIEVNVFATKNSKYIDQNGYMVTIPSGFKILEGLDIIKDGLVVQDILGNEFVWIPVDDINSMAMCSLHGTETLSSNLQCPICLSSTKLVGKLYWNESSWKWSDTAITAYNANSGLREPAYLTDTTYGDVSTTADRGISLLTSIIGITGSNAEILRNWEDMLQRDFNSMIESVEKYKGFYIGRYETSLEEIGGVTRAKSVRNADAMTDENWYNMYKYEKGINTDSVQSSMITGSQWDQTLKWLVASGAKRNADLTNSRSWGNNINYNIWNNYVEGTNEEYVGGAGSKQQTGFSENWKANNIYDLAGNVREWTTEADGTTGRVFRGRRVQLRWLLLFSFLPKRRLPSVLRPRRLTVLALGFT